MMRSDLDSLSNVEKSSSVGPKIITDVDFADDIALISEHMDKTNEFLLRVKSAAASVERKQDQGYDIEYGGSI